MAVFEVNGIEESDGEVVKILPCGIYNAGVIACEFYEIKKDGKYKGAQMFRFTVKAEGDDGVCVTAGLKDFICVPFPGMDSDEKRKALAWFHKIQIACGLEVTNALDNEAFLHCELQVELIEENDEKYGQSNKIKDVLPM